MWVGRNFLEGVHFKNVEECTVLDKEKRLKKKFCNPKALLENKS